MVCGPSFSYDSLVMECEELSDAFGGEFQATLEHALALKTFANASWALRRAASERVAAIEHVLSAGVDEQIAWLSNDRRDRARLAELETAMRDAEAELRLRRAESALN